MKSNLLRVEALASILKSEDAARYHKIQESKVNGLWVGKGEDLGAI
jgi:hypothetical protein